MGAHREHAHVQAVNVVVAVRVIHHALLPGHVLHALQDERPGLGMQHQFNPQRFGRALAGVVIRRGANAAGAKHHIAGLARRGESTRQRGGDAARIVTHILGVAERQTARAQQFNHLGKVFVGALAREDFVANDDESKVCAHGKKDRFSFVGRVSRTPGQTH